MHREGVERGLLCPTPSQLVLLLLPCPLPSIPCSAGATPHPPSPQLPPQFVSHVVHHVGVNWYNFGLYLGISSTVLNVVRVEKRGLTSDCCRDSLHRWLRHDRDTGGKGREVGVVLEAVRNACGPVAVEQIHFSLQGGEVQPASPIPFLQSTPELAALQELVVPFAAAQWEAVADYLLVSYEKRAAIAASERGQVEVCCRELFNQWLQWLPGTGSLSRTWEAVLGAVGEAVGLEVAKQIRARLESKQGGEGGINSYCIHVMYTCLCMQIGLICGYSRKRRTGQCVMIVMCSVALGMYSMIMDSSLPPSQSPPLPHLRWTPSEVNSSAANPLLCFC